MSSPRVGEFEEFMRERHRVYLRRAQGELWPWTTDEALQRAFIINVYRELDTVTRWVKLHIRDAYPDSDLLWLQLVLARIINVPDTIQDLIDNDAWPVEKWHPKRFIRVMEKRMNAGVKTFTSAYMTWGGPDKGRAKHELIADIISHALAVKDEIEPHLHGTLEKAWRALRTLDGVGDFLAYEVVSDMRWTRYLSDAPDINTWANPGPGCKRGLNWVYARPPRGSLPSSQALAEMKALHLLIAPRWPYSPPLEMREIEHSLCEFAKYAALKHDGKRPKRWYRPKKEDTYDE